MPIAEPNGATTPTPHRLLISLTDAQTDVLRDVLLNDAIRLITALRAQVLELAEEPRSVITAVDAATSARQACELFELLNLIGWQSSAQLGRR